MALHVDTPLIESLPLGRAAGREVWLKLDSLQPAGSFKIRGIGLACETQHARGARRFVSSSGGNAGLAVAYAGRRLGVPVTVVVPQSATERAQTLLRQEGAEVRVHGASWQEAHALAQSITGADAALIHPFDDPLLWQGHATLVDEVVRAGLQFDTVLLSVGGGGLLCGVAEGLQRNGLDAVPIIAVETAGAASLRAAIDAGRTVELPRIDSIAVSLGAKRVCERAWQWTREREVRSVVLPDAHALAACERFLDDHRILVEPACGASLAPAYDAASELEGCRRLLVVVCGGVTATLDQMRAWAGR